MPCYWQIPIRLKHRHLIHRKCLVMTFRVDVLVDICINDIFGLAGDERDVQELQGKMKEIKSTKSFDSIEIISKTLDLKYIEKFLVPLKQIMMETSMSKTIKKLEEVLRRIAIGLTHNPDINVQSLLIFIHSLTNENLALIKPMEEEKKQENERDKTFKVELKRLDAYRQPLKYYQANVHLFVDFGLSILLTAIRRERNNLLIFRSTSFKYPTFRNA